MEIKENNNTAVSNNTRVSTNDRPTISYDDEQILDSSTLAEIVPKRDSIFTYSI